MQANVTDLASYRNRDIGDLLAFLAAQYKGGNLDGVVCQIRDSSGAEHPFCAGFYRHNKSAAIAAGLAMSMRMTKAAGGYADSK